MVISYPKPASGEAKAMNHITESSGSSWADKRQAAHGFVKHTIFQSKDLILFYPSLSSRGLDYPLIYHPNFLK
jgi:hypothetical protein